MLLGTKSAGSWAVPCSCSHRLQHHYYRPPFRPSGIRRGLQGPLRPVKIPPRSSLSKWILHSAREDMGPHAIGQAAEAAGVEDAFIELANRLADAAAEVTTKYFRSPLVVDSKADTSPVTEADRQAEAAIRALIHESFPEHDIFGEEGGIEHGTQSEDNAEPKYLWVIDPIDGTKSFITGKPVFGTLIALLRNGVPVLGIIDQPITKERWLGIQGRQTTLNGQPISTRSSCKDLRTAYLYATTPHMFTGDTETAFNRVRDQVRIPLYGCDCYAYGLLSTGFCDLVIEADMKPYDYLALVPIVEGAGGIMTDWEGKSLRWHMTPSHSYAAEHLPGEVIAAGARALHEKCIELLNFDAQAPLGHVVTADAETVPATAQEKSPSNIEVVISEASTSLPSSCAVLTCTDPNNPFGGEQSFYIVGTAHVSTESCEDVRKVIEQVKPEVVFLELCSERQGVLTMTKHEVQSTQELFKLWREGKAPLMMVAYSWMLGQNGDALGVQPGEEFRVALMEAQKVGAEVMLGDRPVRVTLARCWAALSRWARIRFICGLVWGGLFMGGEDLKAQIEQMKDLDVLTEALKEFAEESPQLMRPLVEERDEYMVFLLRTLTTRASKVVAVVGAGHLRGMRECWNSEIDFAEILQMPEPPRSSASSSSGWVSWRNVAVIGLSGLALTAVLSVRWRPGR